MRKYNSNIAFIDKLFNLLVGFTSLFILSFLLINPIADEGKIDPVTELYLTLQWDPNLPPDLDLHMRTPNGDVISFRRKDNGWAGLDRDDLGTSSDKYTVNGEELIVPKNMEVVNINAIVPGEYVVNVHFYGCQCLDHIRENGGDKSITLDMSYEVTLIDMRPFKVMYSQIKSGLSLREEHTVITFVVTEDGRVVDIRTDISVSLFQEESP